MYVTDRFPKTVEQTKRSKYKNELIRRISLPHSAVKQIDRTVRDAASGTPITGQGANRTWNPDSGK